MFCIILTASCSDNITEDNVPDNKETPVVEEKSANECTYLEQTNHYSMLMNMMWYDNSISTYTLSLTEDEALQMGFTNKEYQTVQKYVETLNKIKIVHK